MKNGHEKLTPAEAKRLEKYMAENGGQAKSQELLGVSVGTLSRTLNRHTAPSPLLRGKLIERNIILVKAKN